MHLITDLSPATVPVGGKVTRRSNRTAGALEVVTNRRPTPSGASSGQSLAVESGKKIRILNEPVLAPPSESKKTFRIPMRDPCSIGAAYRQVV
jgi:hypothetical protein